MDNEYRDSHKNYVRLIDTIQILKSGISVHSNFYDINIKHIHMYINVLDNTPDVNQAARSYLETLIKQYELFNEFDLTIYLTACELLLGNIQEFEVQKMLDDLSIKGF